MQYRGDTRLQILQSWFKKTILWRNWWVRLYLKGNGQMTFPVRTVLQTLAGRSSPAYHRLHLLSFSLKLWMYRNTDRKQEYRIIENRNSVKWLWLTLNMLVQVLTALTFAIFIEGFSVHKHKWWEIKRKFKRFWVAWAAPAERQTELSFWIVEKWENKNAGVGGKNVEKVFDSVETMTNQMTRILLVLSESITNTC